jgi:hypothetical protein
MKAGNGWDATSQRCGWLQLLLAAMATDLTWFGWIDNRHTISVVAGAVAGAPSAACWTTILTSLLVATFLPFEYTTTFAMYWPGDGYAWLIAGVISRCAGASLSLVQ